MPQYKMEWSKSTESNRPVEPEINGECHVMCVDLKSFKNPKNGNKGEEIEFEVIDCPHDQELTGQRFHITLWLSKGCEWTWKRMYSALGYQVPDNDDDIAIVNSDHFLNREGFFTLEFDPKYGHNQLMDYKRREDAEPNPAMADADKLSALQHADNVTADTGDTDEPSHF